MKPTDADRRKAQKLCVASAHGDESWRSGMGRCNCISIAQALADERYRVWYLLASQQVIDEVEQQSNLAGYSSEAIAKILEANDTLSMDNESDRKVLAHALWDMIE